MKHVIMTMLDDYNQEDRMVYMDITIDIDSIKNSKDLNIIHDMYFDAIRNMCNDHNIPID